ncbi:TetR/AcrR family transcriptional regulator [Ruminiclostridium cellobioparum]|jgi:probable dihydroxyacetone kinase regulator|uniref:TetR/AcrR family transcriptional regulator n=1 Tax=Ruminiclostridium cellobioparum TaxID=29355 RepID=UPI00048988AE|nr:TetR/AcrR family transcriptional regulator [Ruminiclostridium cellobioparum]
MSQITKKALAASLKKLLSQKPLDKITVIDIVEDCGVNRQTFYYHFQDIYDLVEWMFLTGAAAALNGKKTYDTWQQGFLQVFEYALENKNLVINTYHSISRDQLERYLYDVTYNLLIGVVEEQAAGMAVRDNDKKFIADFYKFAFVGLMLDWIRRGMKDDPEKIVEHISTLIQGDIKRALEKYRT